MATRNLILVLTAEHAYIKDIGRGGNATLANEELFRAISSTYIPFLNMLGKLERDSVPFSLSLVLPPQLCTLLTTPKLQKFYIEWLDKRIELGDEELERNKDNPAILENVRESVKKLQRDKIDFTDVYEKDIVTGFKRFADKGLIELIPTAATNANLPYFADLPEALHAQIDVGLHAHRLFFGNTGEGFYLPYMAWSQKLDSILRSYNVNYTILDTRAFLFATPPLETGIFTPARTHRSLVVFGRDWDTPTDIQGNIEAGGDSEGFMNNAVYRNEERDIGYDLDSKTLKTFFGGTKQRQQTLYKYFNNSESETDNIYNVSQAQEQVKKDARIFVDAKTAKLENAEQYLNGADNTLTCCIPLELLGTKWHEGIDWLESIIRTVAERDDITLSACSAHLQNQYKLPRFIPYPSSVEGTGYSENLLDNKNSWMMPYIRKATERMIDLTERFPSETGIKARLLTLGAKEVLLAQSGDLAKLISEGNLIDFAKDTFKHNILNFSAVFESLASNTVSTEWLCNIEKEDGIFPWLSYKVFSKKK